MSELLTNVPFPVLVIIGILFLFSLIMIAFSYFKNKTLDEVRGDVYQLFLKAENYYTETSAGKQKMKWVVQQARKLLPKWMQAILTEAALEKLLQKWFDEVKDLLDDGKVNGSSTAK